MFKLKKKLSLNKYDQPSSALGSKIRTSVNKLRMVKKLPQYSSVIALEILLKTFSRYSHDCSGLCSYISKSLSFNFRGNVTKAMLRPTSDIIATAYFMS